MKNSSKRLDLTEVIITGLMVALTLVFTFFINIRLPLPGNGGLIHLGNVPLFAAAFIFGKKIGAISGAFGMALFDVISGWTIWAPFTFIIVGLMGYVAGTIYQRFEKNAYVGGALAVLAALIIKVVGYYLAEVILYHNLVAPLGSILGNCLQVAIAGAIMIPVAPRLISIFERSKLCIK